MRASIKTPKKNLLNTAVVPALLVSTLAVLLPAVFVYIFLGTIPSLNLLVPVWLILAGFLFLRWGPARSQRLVPVVSLRTLAWLMLTLLGVLILTEYVFFPLASASFWIVTPAWLAEDDRIDRNMLAELGFLTSDPDWVYRTDYHPVQAAKTSPYRILVMGDSYVIGDGASNFNDLWWRQLQRELEKRGYSQVEVIAAGIQAASTHDQLEHVDLIAREYQPDLIVWGYVTNDPDEGLVRLNRFSTIEDPLYRWHTILLYQGLFPGINFQLRALRERKLVETRPAEAYGYPYETWELQLLQGDNRQAYANTLQELADWSQESGIPYFFMTLPNNPDQERFQRRYDLVAGLFDEAGIPFYNILEDFVQEYGSSQSGGILRWGINPADGHPGPVSTQFFARQAANILEQSYPQVLGAKSAQPLACDPIINQWRPWNLQVGANAGGQIEFTYPENEEWMLRMPYNEAYVQLNLECPAVLESIHLEGAQLKSARLAVSALDEPASFESLAVFDLGKQEGSSLSWSLQDYPFADSVETLRISAVFQGEDRSLHLSFTGAAR